MNIKILSDSTCDLTPEILEKFAISIIPLNVIKDGKEYKDGITITPADIFDHVAAGGALCSTAAVSVGEYIDHFTKFSSAYDAVFHVSIGSGFSASYQNACLAAQEFDNVYCVDSMNLSTGQGLVVLKLRQLADTCDSIDEIRERIRDYTTKVEASFVLDQLQYMAKGGRCSSATALGANLLNLKPCIEVRDGKMSVVKKYRGNFAKCLASYVKDRLSQRDDIDKEVLFVTKTPVNAESYKATMDAVAQFGDFTTLYETDAGCTVSCHCGPSTLGILFARK